MKKILIILATLFLVSGSCWAQDKNTQNNDQVFKHYNSNSNYQGNWSNWGDWYGHSHCSTAAEGYYTGVGRFVRDQGAYWRSVSRAWVNGEIARSMRIQNHIDAVHTWWQLKDEYKERFRKEHPTWPERQEKRFDMAIKVYEVKEKEKKLITAGILPPKQPQSFTYRGRTYPSYDAFKRSPDWLGMKMEALQNSSDRERRQQERDERFRQVLKRFEESRLTVKGPTY